MVFRFNRFYKAIILFIPALSMQSIYSSESIWNRPDFSGQDTFKEEDLLQLHPSYTDDSLNQVKSEKNTMGGQIRLVKEINGIKVYQFVSTHLKKDSEDTLLLDSDSTTSKSYANRTRKPETDDFKIFAVSPYSKSNPIPAGINLPDGLIFRIQLGAFSKQVSDDAFKGLSPVSYEIVDGKLKYYTGIFYSSESAGKALKEVREYGFPDSFLVAFYNGKIISIEKAREVEYSQIKL